MKSAVVFVAGAAVGVYGVLKTRRVAEAFTPEGLHDRANALRLGAQLFRQEVAQGQAEAEFEMRQRLRALHDASSGDGPRELAAHPQPSSPSSQHRRHSNEEETR